MKTVRKRTSREPFLDSETWEARGTGAFYYNARVPRLPAHPPRPSAAHRPRPSAARRSRPLPHSFYARKTLTVARELLGATLARELEDGRILRGRIVEVEAYVGEEDKACHARAGITPRTEPLYGPPGFAYVYLTYGMHYMLNAVTEPEGHPAAVLIRAAEPLEGIEAMIAGRSARAGGAPRANGHVALHNLASGPAKLTQAFGLDLRHNRADLGGPTIWIEAGTPFPDARVRTSARIGCETARAPWDKIPWRFYVADSPFVTPGRSLRNGEGLRARDRKNSG